MQAEKKSQVASSTRQIESVVVKAPLGKLWEPIRCLKFEELFPSRITKSEYVKGNPGIVGSLVKVTFKDGSKWTYCINEISDLNHRVIYELVETDPKCTVTSAMNEIRLHCVTDDNSTFIKWETNFSNDADVNVLQDNKFKKIDYFNDLKKACSC